MDVLRYLNLTIVQVFYKKTQWMFWITEINKIKEPDMQDMLFECKH